MGVRLPAEYQEVEYLGWTTSTYLLLNTLSDVSTRGDLAGYAFECVLSHLSYKTGSLQNLCIGFGEGAAQYIGANNNKVGLGTSNRLDAAVIPASKNTYSFRSYGSYAELSCNGYSVSRTTATETALNAIFFVGARYSKNSGSGRFYWCKLSKGDNVISIYVPCYRKSDDEAGLYDLVSGTFFTNQGAGEFLVGPDVIDSISPWLVARRRMLMRQYIGYEENKGFTGSYSNVSTGTLVGRFLTGFIPIKGAKRLSCYYGGNITNGSKHFMVEYNGDKIYTDQKGYWDMTVKNQRTVTLYTSDVQYVRFSGFMDEIDQCYVKNADTGEILWKKGM